MDDHATIEAIDRLVPIDAVCNALSRSRASIYRDIERGNFPKPYKIGGSSRWPISAVRAAIAAARPGDR